MALISARMQKTMFAIMTSGYSGAERGNPGAYPEFPGVSRGIQEKPGVSEKIWVNPGDVWGPDD